MGGGVGGGGGKTRKQVAEGAKKAGEEGASSVPLASSVLFLHHGAGEKYM